MPESEVVDSLKRLKRSPSRAAQVRSGKWLKDKINKSKGKRIGKSSRPTIGKMYLMGYNPKHSDTLPYYDALPLIIPIGMYSDGFLALNLHYLPAKPRINLLLALMQTMTGKGENARIKASYEMLNAAAKYKEFTPTVHRYLWSQISSPPLIIEPDDWEYVALLPLAKFKKKSRAAIYRDSMGMI